MTTTFEQFNARLGDFIRRYSFIPTDAAESVSDNADEEFNELALLLFALQFNCVEPYRRFCVARKVSPAGIADWSQIPAMPTSAFKELELTSLPVGQRTRVFHSSGTTEQKPSRHFHSAESLAIYEASLLPWFKQHLLPDANKFAFIILTPSPALAPYSSLVHMFEITRREFGSANSLFTGITANQGVWGLDFNATLGALRRSTEASRPVALLGTAFSFVHLLDHLTENRIRFELPAGSRVMETGGYKGRSRVLSKAELHDLITRHLGVAPPHIVCEYGMSELGSQAYDRNAGEISRSERILHFPPWARAQIVSPETGRETRDGETGLIRVFDLANVRSVMAIQTEDLGVRRGDGFEMIGRNALAEPRGCSLMSAEDSVR